MIRYCTRWVGFILITCGLLAAPGAVPQDTRTGGVLRPPRVGLLPVHEPDLNKLEVEVREQLVSFRNALAEAAKAPNTSDAALGEAYGVLGQAYHAYALTQSAEECYFNALHLLPADFQWPHLLAVIYRETGRLDEAAVHYKRALTLRPDYPATRVGLGDVFLQQNQLAEARTEYEGALALDPKGAAANYGLGQVALAERRYAEAVRHFEAALAALPDANRVHYSLAMAYRGLGNTEKAQAHLQQQGTVGVRAADPLLDGLKTLVQGERVHMVRGRLAYDAKRYGEAAEEYRKAVAARPANDQARINLGAALSKLGDTPGAIAQFREALKANPKGTVAHYNLSLLLAIQGELGEAIEHAQAALDADPQDTGIRLELARELRRAGRAEEALTHYGQVVEADLSNEDALLDLADLLSKKKDYPGALQWLEKGNTRYPQQGRTAIALAYFLASCPRAELRNGARALELSRQVFDTTKLVNHGEVVAMALAELGRCGEAAALQKNLVEAAERDRRQDLAERMKAALSRYAQQPCRPPVDIPKQP